MVEKRNELGIVTWTSKRFGKTLSNCSPLTHFFEDDEIEEAQEDRYGDLRYIIGYTDESPTGVIPPEIISLRVKDKAVFYTPPSFFDLDFFKRVQPLRIFNKEIYWKEKVARLSRRMTRNKKRKERIKCRRGK